MKTSRRLGTRKVIRSISLPLGMPSNLNLLQHLRNLVLFKELGSVLLSPPLYSFSFCPSLVSEVFPTYSLRTDCPILFDCSPDLLFRNILLRLWTYEKGMSKGFKIKRGGLLAKDFGMREDRGWLYSLNIILTRGGLHAQRI